MNKVISLVFRKLTQNEFKAITNTINSVGGGSQTYIDFPKGSISDDDFQEFFDNSGVSNDGQSYSWSFKVNSLSLGRTQQDEIISTRRQSSNSLREQNNEKRIEILKPENSGFPNENYDSENNPIIMFILKDDEHEYWAGWFYREEMNDSWYLNKTLSNILWNDCGYLKFDLPIMFDNTNFKWPFGIPQMFEKIIPKEDISIYNKFIYALRTKPFLLLAGISGTGKSRIVREFAFKSCPKFLQDKDGTTPGNYCMIEVKPNWHDSTELLGYYSNLSKGYQFKKFVKFLVKAKMFPDVPFFVCLDEMNIAPVEQYFAEILSILETRKHPKYEGYDSVDMNTIKTEIIIDAKYFRELEEMPNTRNSHTGESFSRQLTDRDIYMKLFGIDTENDILENVGNRNDLTTEGLSLPDNVLIIGTVNMDDTTHQFSRKVIDRALTIEMNGGKLSDMFGGSKKLEYTKDEDEQKFWQQAFSQHYVTADEVIEKHPNEAEEIKALLPQKLDEINKALKGTPFEVSYRVLNELTIMVGVMLDDNNDEQSLENIIDQAVNNILLMKILPRIEGDAEMFALSKEYTTQNDIKYNDRLEWLKAIAPDIHTEEGKDNQQTAKQKIQEMIDRLYNQDFTRFWP